MKLVIAAFSTALVLATSASAMIGPYERAVDDPAATADLFTTGAQDVTATGSSTSPEADWNNGEAKTRSVFSTKGDSSDQHFGANAR